MSSQRTSIHNSPVLCTWQSLSICQECQTNGKLMCRFDRKDIVNFFMIILPFGVTAIAGTIRAGYGWYLLLWFAYSLFFFFVWEARVLCRHCPYWAEAGTILHCHANYGVIKLWKYQPGPMNKWTGSFSSRRSDRTPKSPRPRGPTGVDSRAGRSAAETARFQPFTLKAA